MLRSVLVDAARAGSALGAIRTVGAGAVQSARSQRAFGQVAGIPEVRIKFRVEVVASVTQAKSTAVMYWKGRSQVGDGNAGLNLKRARRCWRACRTSWSPSRPRKIWSSGATAHTAGIVIPLRAVEHRSEDAVWSGRGSHPRWNRCPCQQSGPKTFRPAAAWLRGTTTPNCCIWRPSGRR